MIFIPKESEQKKQKAEYRRNEVLPLVEIQFSCSSFTPQDQPANQKTPAASTMSARSQVDKVCRLEDAQGYEFVHVWKPEKGTEECAAEMQPFTSLPVYQPTQTPPAASTMSARSQVDKVCRLEDAQGYEFVHVWKPEKGTEECAAEMQPFTSLPVYQPTQTPPAASTMRAPSQGDKVCRLEDAQGYEFALVWKPEKGTEECGVEMQPFASLPGYLIMSLAQPDAG